MTVNVSDQFKPYKCVLKHKLYHNLSTSVRIKTLLVFFFWKTKLSRIMFIIPKKKKKRESIIVHTISILIHASHSFYYFIYMMHSQHNVCLKIKQHSYYSPIYFMQFIIYVKMNVHNFFF